MPRKFGIACRMVGCSRSCRGGSRPRLGGRLGGGLGAGGWGLGRGLGAGLHGDPAQLQPADDAGRDEEQVARSHERGVVAEQLAVIKFVYERPCRHCCGAKRRGPDIHKCYPTKSGITLGAARAREQDMQRELKLGHHRAALRCAPPLTTKKRSAVGIPIVAPLAAWPRHAKVRRKLHPRDSDP